MKERKFYLQLEVGKQVELSELDYRNIKDRIHSGRTNGYYTQRDEQGPERFGQFAFKYLVRVWSDSPENKDVTLRKPEAIDVKKRKPAEVGKPEPKKAPGCDHDWNDPKTWRHVTTIVGGNNRYYKMCNECGAKSQLVKKREVELAQEAIGETIDTVPLVE